VLLALALPSMVVVPVLLGRLAPSPPGVRRTPSPGVLVRVSTPRPG
jgi:hypothetical protein